ncbi:hypothetical protein [Streptomyces sp. NPDC008121]|uniref:hypothetical protein n=1 Tax=Streptomyces sp. NPDC008121 TaxID=3364809 RepID=UPI0036E36C1C
MRRLRPVRVAGLMIGAAGLSAPHTAAAASRATGAVRRAGSGADALAEAFSDALSPAGAVGLAGGGLLAGFGAARFVRGRRRSTPRSGATARPAGRRPA